MSNPFLVDLDENYTPYTSGISTPFSGAATPTTKRRNSTNPFEILSPDGDEQPVTFLDHDALQSAANEINNNNNGKDNGQQNVASAIADMTADFYQAITKHDFNFDATINDDVFEHEQAQHSDNRLDEGEDNLEAHDDEVEEGEDEEDNNNVSRKPVTTVKTVQSYLDEDQTLFDPFETIHDDDGMSSKRSSVEVANLGSTMMTSNKTVTELASSLVSANSAKAKELFNSSMASFELLAAGGKAASENQNSSANQNDLLLSPMTPSTPPSNYDDNSAEIGGSGGFGGSSGLAAFLSPAPTGMDIYSSDLSEMSDVSPTAAAAGTDVRSAFNMYSGT